jgi:UDP-N-acetylmuramoyl-tripeptide--D-alanyl-D-alanine ligase
MSRLQLGELAAMLDGRLHGADAAFDGVGSDTRSLQAGELFVALHGPSFDGHDFVAQAAARGAAGALVGHRVDAALAQVEVADTLAGLGRLGREWRRRCAARVLGITGSNGKTTLKEMCAAILSRCGSTLATRGNLNNAIGVPLTLCRLRDEAYAVIEMGANHMGEIDYLTRLVEPDVAILNNAGRAHLEGFGSIENIARGKAEIINGLRPGGTFVFNGDDRFADLWRALGSRLSLRTFGVRSQADVSSPADVYRVVWGDGAFETRFPVRCEAGEAEVSLALAGEHNRMNALAAIAGCLALGASLDAAVEGLAGLRPVAGRLCPLAGINGARLIDDSYNANPDSVLAALRVLAAAPGRRTLVLGDLAELGEGADRLHGQLGRQAAELGIHRLFATGPLSAAAAAAFGAGGLHFDDQQALIDALGDGISAEDSVLVKGSRSARMDRVVLALRAGEAPC